MTTLTLLSLYDFFILSLENSNFVIGSLDAINTLKHFLIGQFVKFLPFD